jgi:hypothetical protein
LQNALIIKKLAVITADDVITIQIAVNFPDISSTIPQSTVVTSWM